jgi:hypothetical protein
MAVPPLPLAVISVGDFLTEMLARTRDRAQCERIGRDLYELARNRMYAAQGPDPAPGIPGLPFPANDGRQGTPGNALTQDQADRLFAELSALDHVPFDYPEDGCNARAHEVCRAIAARGYACGKLWNFPAPAPLVVRGTEFGDCEWGHHVAAVVWVEGKDGRPREMVFDPSLGQQPLEREEWQRRQAGPADQRLERTDPDTYGYMIAEGDRRDPTVREGALRFDADYALTDATNEYYSIQRDLRRLGVPIRLP